MAARLHSHLVNNVNGRTYVNRTILSASMVALLGSTLLAQNTATTPQPQTSQPAAAGQAQPAATGQAAMTTVTGCVYEEKSVPGRAPNVAERAGVLEDYILAEVKPAQSAPASGTAGAIGTSGAMNAMYKLEFVEDDKLRALVGKRVEVTGRIDAEEGDANPASGAPAPTSPTDRVIGRDQVNLSEFEVTSIREVAGACPAAPSVR